MSIFGRLGPRLTISPLVWRGIEPFHSQRDQFIEKSLPGVGRVVRLGGIMLPSRSLAAALAAFVLAAIMPQLTHAREIVGFSDSYSSGAVVVKTNERVLYYVLGGKAVRYPVGVGRRGKQWTGTAFITSKQLRPAWSPHPASLAIRPLATQLREDDPDCASGHRDNEAAGDLTQPDHGLAASRDCVMEGRCFAHHSFILCALIVHLAQ